jgi:hypothetical protein
VVEVLDLQTKTEDLAIVFNGEFNDTAGLQGMERKVAFRILNIGFCIVEVLAEIRGNQFLRGAKGEFSHGMYLQSDFTNKLY